MGPLANNAGLETLTLSNKSSFFAFFAKNANESVQNENPKKRTLGDSLTEPVRGFMTPKKVSIQLKKITNKQIRFYTSQIILVKQVQLKNKSLTEL